MLPPSALYAPDYIAYCELLHFGLAFLAGSLGFWLTQIICSRAWPGSGSYLSPYAAALACAFASHWIEDVTVCWF